ncbi:peptidoglycan-binding domain-containing protein [Kamptonema sp. UHCC 0994]|uniref:peptidoglycan-binding domain-containing protein n=1 Tax=Kamptonema sp. UHCC 0994 TaxID=3031329 RepID=UPI0023B954CB|nr:peptidoglycan-binding domain-containing protein [Kamptonema sp. UHCC 0994]MDF0553840.1 peptidoglycan-binding domain-containing protein [Kamptonema sp. UHCC 0994]
MDSFAYLELALVWESPTEPKLLEGLNWKKLSSQTYIPLLSLVLVLSVLSIANSANAELRPGSNGEQVRALQQRLQAQGYFPIGTTPTIRYRSITEEAVRQFQLARGLRATGIADDFTLYYLGLGPYPRTPSQGYYPPSPIGQPSNTSTTIRTCQGLRFENKRYPSVTSLQQKLKALGFFYGAVDGKYRERTLSAVTRFQQANNLVATGCADQTTLYAIDLGIAEISYANPPIIPPLQPPYQQTGLTTLFTLGRNSRGPAVRELQSQLRRLGITPGAIDGVFGNDTEYAVKRFQERAGLYRDGIATPNVQIALRNIIAGNVPIPFGSPLYVPRVVSR